MRNVKKSDGRKADLVVWKVAADLLDVSTTISKKQQHHHHHQHYEGWWWAMLRYYSTNTPFFVAGLLERWLCQEDRRYWARLASTQSPFSLRDRSICFATSMELSRLWTAPHRSCSSFLASRSILHSSHPLSLDFSFKNTLRTRRRRSGQPERAYVQCRFVVESS